MKEYRNPLPVDSMEQNTPSIADPFVLKYCGCYYCYSTSVSGVRVLLSEDLLSFTNLGYALQTPGEMEYWAPCVVYCNGIFYMYYSSRPQGEADVHRQRMKVATASTPEGPFVYRATLKDTFCIDADIQVQAHEKWRIFYATNDFRGNDDERPGTCVVEDTLEDPFTLSGYPREAIVPTRDAEVFCRNRFGDGRDWHTIEGPCFYASASGDSFLMYSGNAYTSEHYFMDYATRTPDGWQKHDGPPLLHSYDELLGPGHNSVVKGPNLLEDWIVYHGMPKGGMNECPDPRQLCISRLLSCGARLWLQPDQYAPQQPVLRCFYRLSPLLPEASWETVSGVWQPAQGELSQNDECASGLILTAESFESYALEVSLREIPSFRNCVYGAAAAYMDASNRTMVWLDACRSELIVSHTVQGISSKRTVSLDGVDFRAYQTLHMEKALGELSIRLGSGKALRLKTFQGPVRAGLATERSRACFSGFTLQRVYEPHSFAAFSDGFVAVENTGGAAFWDERGLHMSEAILQYARSLPEAWEMQFALRFDTACDAQGFEVTLHPAGEQAPLTIAVEAGSLAIASGGHRRACPLSAEDRALLLLQSFQGRLMVACGGQHIALDAEPIGSFRIRACRRITLQRLRIAALEV